MDPNLEESEDSEIEIPVKIQPVKKRKRVMDPNLEQSEDSDIDDDDDDEIPKKEIQSVKNRRRYMDPNIEESEDDEDDETAVQENDYIQRDHFKIKGELRTISKKFNGFNLLI